MAALPIKQKHCSDIINAGGLVVAVQNCLDAYTSQLTLTGITESSFATCAV
jgi:hypothetical protein